LHALPVPDGEAKMVVVAARAGKTGASTTADAASGASARPTGASLISVNGDEAFHRTPKQVRSGSADEGVLVRAGRVLARPLVELVAEAGVPVIRPLSMLTLTFWLV